MKMVKTTLAGVVVSALLSSAAMAASTDQGSGTITFKGTIVDAPCSIKPNSVKQEIPMGTISNAAIRNDKTSVTPFSIELEGCDLQKYNEDGTPANGQWSGVNVEFKGTTVGTDKKYLGVTENVGIQLTHNGQPIIIDTPVKLSLKAGSQVLGFGAQVKAVDKTKAIPLTDFNTVANFSLTYD